MSGRKIESFVDNSAKYTHFIIHLNIMEFRVNSNVVAVS